MQVCGCPGQDRFDFLRQWDVSASPEVFVMEDANAPGVVQSAGILLAEAAAAEHPCGLCHGYAGFSDGLQAAGHGVVPGPAGHVTPPQLIPQRWPPRLHPYMHIEYLADCEEHLDTIAEWQQSEFGYLNPAITLDQRRLRLRDTLKKRKLPLTMVARSQTGEPIGAASLVPRTLTHPQLTPWLSMVVVPPAWRGRGIASLLSLRIADEARSMGFPSVHLFTLRHASLYEHLGWRTIEHSELNGIPITVMSRTTTV